MNQCSITSFNQGVKDIMNTPELRKGIQMLDAFNAKILEIRKAINTLQTEYGLHLENLKCEELDYEDRFRRMEYELIMYHLNDSFEDITYINRPVIAEGSISLSEDENTLLVGNQLVNLKEPVEVKLDADDDWYKTWISKEGDEYCFTALMPVGADGRRLNVLEATCIFRLRDCHK